MARSDTLPDVSAGPTKRKESEETVLASMELFSCAHAPKASVINSR